MSFKVINVKLAGSKVRVSREQVDFDTDGVGEIQSEEIYKEVLSLQNFFPFEKETGVSSHKVNNTEKTENEEGDNKEPSEEQTTENEVKRAKENMTHDELNDLAKELGIFDNEDYPVDEKKGIKTAYINAHIDDQK